MQTCVFLDLDDTIFQTAPKCPAGVPVQAVAVRKDGAPLSYMTERQRALFQLLASCGRVIPTTGRNLDAFRRVALTFHDIAVLDFGGVILMADGTPDPEWDAGIRPLAMAQQNRFESALRALYAVNVRRRLGATVRVISDFDMPLYLVAKHPDANVDALAVLRSECAPALEADGFLTHANHNNLSFMPEFVGKERAVRHVIERHLGPEPWITVGIGDSLTDAPFMNLCDYSLVPKGSQLASQLTGRQR